MTTACCEHHIPGGCWYDPCCGDCPEYLCTARLTTTGQRCTLKPHGASTDPADHEWAASS